MEPFTEKVVQTILSIPPGKVMTYGQVAEVAGNYRAARQVTRILHTLTEKFDLPWHRVVNAKGEISIPDYEVQRELLIEEGIEFIGEKRIDLSVYRHEMNPL